MVAGGYPGDMSGEEMDLTSVLVFGSSVLTLLPGATAWTPLASLPRALFFTHASIVGGKMRVTGGVDGSSRRSEVVTNNYSDAM